MVHLTQDQAGTFYAVHRRPFYRSLVQFMSSGPIVPIALEGENAIERLRKLMGATDPAKADSGTIRKDLATNVEQNAIHGSDSEASVQTELPFFFGNSDLVSYYKDFFMKIYDVSVPIDSSTPVFPGDPEFRSKEVRSLNTKGDYQLHEVTMGNHIRDPRGCSRSFYPAWNND